MCYSEINQTRFLNPADHLDRTAQQSLGLGQETSAVTGLAQGISAHNTNLAGRDLAQTLTEAGQTIQSALAGFPTQPLLFVQSGGKLDHFFHPVQHLQMTVYHSCDNHMKAVGAKIDRRNIIGWHGVHEGC